jgi:hypothetical protein
MARALVHARYSPKDLHRALRTKICESRGGLCYGRGIELEVTTNPNTGNADMLLTKEGQQQCAAEGGKGKKKKRKKKAGSDDSMSYKIEGESK